MRVKMRLAAHCGAWVLFVVLVGAASIVAAQKQGSGSFQQTNPATEESSPPQVESRHSPGGAADDFGRRALSAYFGRNRRQLLSIYDEARVAEDTAGKAADLRLSDAILYLYNNTLPEREEFLAAQEAAARQIRNEELRQRILLSLLDDEYYELNQLKGENQFNKFSRVFNRASSSLSKLALFQPQDAAQLLLDAAYSLKKARTTTERERMMVFTAKKFLAKYPEAPERPEVEELLRQLNAKLQSDWVKKEVAAGQVALDQGNYRAAIFHLENAIGLDPANEEAGKLLNQARDAEAQLEQARALAVSVADHESQLSSADAAILEAACRALVSGKDTSLADNRPSDPELAASLVYAQAASLERRGNHEKALSLLAELAEIAPNGTVGNLAKGLLANPDYNLGAAFDEAIAQIREERKKFIMTGRRTADETAYVMGSAAVQNVGSMANVPALFFTDMLVRGVAERFRTQVAVDAAVDAGAAYLRRYPASPRAQEIAKVVAELSARSGDLQRTRLYLQFAGEEDPKKLAKLREDEARRQFELAAQTANLAERKRLLEALVRDYPDCKITATAQRELDKLPPTVDEGAIVLTRKMLASDGELVQALGLDPALVDGQKRNGEITDEGIAIDAAATQYSFKLCDAVAFERRPIAKARRDWIIARSRALLAASGFEVSSKQALRRRVLPVEIEGGAGSSGIEVAPKLLPYPDRSTDARYFR